MCYDISTGLLDTNMKRLCMCDKPSQLCWPPHKSRTANLTLFTKENAFCMTFELAFGRSACRWAYV